jgi:beta-N-acetylhexosaminidase
VTARQAAPVQDVRGLLMLAFDGLELPVAMAERLRSAPAAGITLFRYQNVADAAQLRALTEAIQAAAAGGGRAADGPLLVAADQEGGQLAALGDVATVFPGNMALGATGDAGLAERVGRATGMELRALGVNVAYAPACDLATNAANPGIGIRSFGADPAAAAALAAAMTRGLRSAGVAATAKHFPGLGDAGVDSHLGLPAVGRDRAGLLARELIPFRAAIEAGADLVMSAHVALPGVTGEPSLAATLSRVLMHDILRRDLGFDGLAITDALDMAALPQGDGQVDAVLRALAAGVDLLLCASDEAARLRIEAGLARAASEGRLDPAAIAASRARLAALRGTLRDHPEPAPDAAIVRSAAHERLAAEVAARAMTLVRDEAGLLPLRLPDGARIAAVMPRPADLTPADTSSRVAPALAMALRGRHGHVTEVLSSLNPDDGEIAAIRSAAAGHDLIVVGTISASLHPGQARLVEALLQTGVPAVTIALRTPFDLAAYPAAGVHICTYGIHEPSLRAAAEALFGVAGFSGRLPAPIGGIAAMGHGLVR